VIGWSVKDALAATVEELRATVVTCGTCPISIQCAVRQGGTGWRFTCCQSTGVNVGGDDDMFHLGLEEGEVVIVDCARQQFPRRPDVEGWACMLCSGKFASFGVLRGSERMRYLPTAYAAVSLETRVDAWRRGQADAQALRARLDAVPGSHAP